MTDITSEKNAALVSTEPITPKDFCELFRHLRERISITPYEFGKRVGYSRHAITTNENQTRNPTIKTVIRYMQAFGLEMTISPRGVTIRDPGTDTFVVLDWPVVVV